MRFFCAHCLPSLCLSLSTAWKPSSGWVPGRVLRAIYVRPRVSGPLSVCVLQIEKTDRLASGNMDCVVRGCTSRAESSEHFSRRGCEGVALHVCVCVFAASMRRRRKHLRSSSHTSLPSYQPSRYSEIKK